MAIRVFRNTSLAITATVCLIDLVLVSGFQLLLWAVGSWPASGFGVSHSYYVTVALATAIGVISSTWLSLNGFVTPFASTYDALWRAWPQLARRRVLSRTLGQVLRLSLPTFIAALGALGVLRIADPVSTPLLPALGIGIGASMLVACGTWCSLLAGIRAGRPAVALLCAMLIGLFLPNGFANSVHEAAGIVLCSMLLGSLLLTGVFTAIFWHWFKGPAR